MTALGAMYRDMAVAPCSTCGAKIGEPCVTMRGGVNPFVAAQAHAARRDAAQAERLRVRMVEHEARRAQ